MRKERETDQNNNGKMFFSCEIKEDILCLQQSPHSLSLDVILKISSNS